MQKLCFFLWGLSLFITARAQNDAKENNVWAFGNHCGLDFSSGQPVAFETHMLSEGGCASVCDAAGNLLFYSAPDTIWNREHHPMPDGYGLTHTKSPYDAYRGSAIVPVINTLNQYYVFSLSGIDNFSPYGSVLSYSVVDMRLANGLGNVVPGKKHIIIDSGFSEAMVAVRGNNCNIWLVLHNIADNKFKVYEISASGISPQPVISAIGRFDSSQVQISPYYFSSIKVSPDRKKICICNVPGFNGGGAVLYNFDANTGIVSAPFVLSSNLYFSSCFSPSNTKLYLANISLSQVDLSLPDSNAIRQSLTLISALDPATHNACDTRIGPDGKLYGVLTDFYQDIACINYPDAPAASCGFTLGTSTRPWGNTRTQLTMEYVPVFTNKQVVRSDSSFCTGNTPITLRAPAGRIAYYWDNGSSDSTRAIAAAGTYWVQTIMDCNTLGIDTFVIKEQDFNFSIGPDTALCSGEYISLHIPVDNASYLWQDGFRLQDRNISIPGLYWATVNKEGCKKTDSINIGSDNCNCNIAFPNAFSPNNDGINDAFGPVVDCPRAPAYYKFRIFNRWGQKVFETAERTRKWNGAGQETGTYFYELVYSSRLNAASGTIINEQNMRVLKGDVTLVR